MTSKAIVSADRKIISRLNDISEPLARLALFTVYFWFGFLKVLGLSPANPLVASLLEKTLPFITFPTFIFWFGVFEVIIGVLWMVPGAERAVIALLGIHLITTVLPLILLPSITWSAPFVPTLEGQYIIKNLAIIALAVVIGARLNPFTRTLWQRLRGK